MIVGNQYKNYEIIQICYGENFGVYLMQNIENKKLFGVLDYNFETCCVHDFIHGINAHEALDLFVKRMPINNEVVETNSFKRSLYSDEDIKKLKEECLSQISINIYDTYRISNSQKRFIENNFDYDDIIDLYIENNESWYKAIWYYIRFNKIQIM